MLGIVSEMLEMAFVVRSCSEINDATANWSGSPAFWKKNRLPFFFFFFATVGNSVLVAESAERTALIG